MDLHEYNSWRRALVPHEIGTRFQFMSNHQSVNARSSFAIGQIVELISVDAPMFKTPSATTYPCDQSCHLILVSKTGKRYTKDLRVTVEGLHKWVRENKILIL